MGKLHIGSAGFHPNLAHDGNSRIPQVLVFAVGQGLDGRNGNRVACMHAHGIQVFNRANNHTIVLAIPHDFELELFPAQHRLFDKDFGDDAVADARTGNIE